MNDLDITKLIQVTQDLIHDGRMEMAESGEAPVQGIVIEGQLYVLSVKLKLKPGDSGHLPK